jgi:hypothetical protein
MYTVEDLPPNNSGYQVRYDDRRASFQNALRNTLGTEDGHLRMSYNKELALHTTVGYTPNVEYANGIYHYDIPGVDKGGKLLKSKQLKKILKKKPYQKYW